MKLIVHRDIFKALIVGSSLLACLFIENAHAADTLTPDADGYIRDWIMLAPIAFPEGETGSDALFKQQIKDEATLQPKAGDKVKIGGKELTWQNIAAATNYFDFNAILKSVN